MITWNPLKPSIFMAWFMLIQYPSSGYMELGRPGAQTPRIPEPGVQCLELPQPGSLRDGTKLNDEAGTLGLIRLQGCIMMYLKRLDNQLRINPPLILVKNKENEKINSLILGGASFSDKAILGHTTPLSQPPGSESNLAKGNLHTPRAN